MKSSKVCTTTRSPLASLLLKRLGNQARNCKMDYSMKYMNSVVPSFVKSKVTNFVFQANEVRSMQVPYMS